MPFSQPYKNDKGKHKISIFSIDLSQFTLCTLLWRTQYIRDHNQFFFWCCVLIIHYHYFSEVKHELYSRINILIVSLFFMFLSNKFYVFRAKSRNFQKGKFIMVFKIYEPLKFWQFLLWKLSFNQALLW